MENDMGHDLESKITLEEFLAWPQSNENPYEFIEGYPIKMQAPTTLHQDIVEYIEEIIIDYFKGTQCKKMANRNVKLFNDRNDLVIPDLFVLCDQSKKKKVWIEGALDLVIEVWSRSNTRWERLKKLDYYKKAGVSEIIGISLSRREVEVYYAPDYLDIPKKYSFDNEVESVKFPGLKFCLKDFRREEL